jgi:hypothetical protein
VAALIAPAGVLEWPQAVSLAALGAAAIVIRPVPVLGTFPDLVRAENTPYLAMILKCARWNSHPKRGPVTVTLDLATQRSQSWNPKM